MQSFILLLELLGLQSWVVLRMDEEPYQQDLVGRLPGSKKVVC